jgi:hypothetical protein
MEVKLHIFWTFALDKGGCLASPWVLYSLSPRKSQQFPPLDRRLGGPRIDLKGTVVKTKVFVHAGIEPQSSSPQYKLEQMISKLSAL